MLSVNYSFSSSESPYYKFILLIEIEFSEVSMLSWANVFWPECMPKVPVTKFWLSWLLLSWLFMFDEFK